ncbi:hypothetical protein OKW21_006043 [Catalinimonas alkaloidigena]|uniref:hypothetical protein n=1 Tax=Catalinimonas alkaloidigena TaxID=1075417 RepID=UPI002406C2F4|nr:hypothetical protein [Catalinimonas alkaloidigena]MDF9800780.1 hypothetical protein [Catalinimonas alkaloidigena]
MLSENIKLVQGDQLEIPFQILDDDIVLTAGWGALFQVRKYTYSEAIISASYGLNQTGVTFTGPNTGVIIIPSSFTVIPADLYQFQLQFISPEGEPFTAFGGKLQVLQDIAYTVDSGEGFPYSFPAGFPS